MVICSDQLLTSKFIIYFLIRGIKLPKILQSSLFLFSYTGKNYTALYFSISLNILCKISSDENIDGILDCDHEKAMLSWIVN